MPPQLVTVATIRFPATSMRQTAHVECSDCTSAGTIVSNQSVVYTQSVLEGINFIAALGTSVWTEYARTSSCLQDERVLPDGAAPLYFASTPVDWLQD